MKLFWILIYNLIIVPILLVFVHITALFNKKMRLMKKVRKNQLEKISNNCSIYKNCLWFHVASAGEFETAKPIIEKIKSNVPG